MTELPSPSHPLSGTLFITTTREEFPRVYRQLEEIVGHEAIIHTGIEFQSQYQFLLIELADAATSAQVQVWCQAALLVAIVREVRITNAAQRSVQIKELPPVMREGGIR